MSAADLVTKTRVLQPALQQHLDEALRSLALERHHSVEDFSERTVETLRTLLLAGVAWGNDARAGAPWDNDPTPVSPRRSSAVMPRANPALEDTQPQRPFGRRPRGRPSSKPPTKPPAKRR